MSIGFQPSLLDTALDGVGHIGVGPIAEGVRRTGRSFSVTALQRSLTSMTSYDVGGFRLNLRAGVRDSAWAIDLVTVTADGRVVR